MINHGGSAGVQGVDSMAELIAAARKLIVTGRRAILGITGSPGSGKSTLAEAIATALGADAALVGLDGFHLSDAELTRLGRHDRKGAADTFDVDGYISLLRRLRDRTEDVVYAPYFDRALEESIGSAIPVPSTVPLIVTEGNYLLVDNPQWSSIAGLLDECWFVEPGEDVRITRLIARHVTFGRTPDQAHERSYGSDQRNAELVASTKTRATRVVHAPPIHHA